MHPPVRRDLARLGQKLLKLRPSIASLITRANRIRAGQDLHLKMSVLRYFFLTTLNDTFSSWAFTARAEGPRPNRAAIALRGCLPASCLNLVTSSAVQRRWIMDLAIFQLLNQRHPCQPADARTTLPKDTRQVYRSNRSIPILSDHKRASARSALTGMPSMYLGSLDLRALMVDITAALASPGNAH
jgi:hypothetical protein